MALQTSKFTSSTLPSNYSQNPNSRKAKSLLCPCYPSIWCKARIFTPGDVETDDGKRTQFDFLSVQVTLTVFSASLCCPSAALAKVSEKRSSKKSAEALTPEQLKSPSEGLPQVSSRIPYTDLIELRKQGRLKHVIKAPSTGLRKKVEPVLVVLDDDRVDRTVLPSVDGNEKFWDLWNESGPILGVLVERAEVYAWVCET